MAKRKILRIIARLNIGGPAIHVILLSSGLAQKGYETLLITGQEGPHEGNMLDLAAAKGVAPVVIPEMGRELSSGGDLAAFLKIFRLVRDARPEIIHTHTAKAGTLGRLAAFSYNVLQRLQFKRSRVIILHTFHGHVLKGYFGGLKTRIFILIEKILACFTDRIITLSEGLKEELAGMGIASREKIEVVPLGLELERFVKSDTRKGAFKKSLGLPEDCLVVGLVGRLVPIKGHKFFLEAARSVIDARCGRSGAQPVRFVVVGDGELRAELEEYAHKLGISGQVIFTGFRSDLPEIYADTDIVVLSSLNEGTPVSLIEAMASGKPVVATRVGGVPDLVADGTAGILVPAGDSGALADAVAKLIEHPELRVRMGEEGRNAVFPKYDIGNLVSRLDLLYGTLIGGMRPAVSSDMRKGDHER
ncbi:MAG TPA: glycosyltransferase family 4 protein [Dissulfurispiraceae bacterium]